MINESIDHVVFNNTNFYRIVSNILPSSFSCDLVKADEIFFGRKSFLFEYFKSVLCKVNYILIFELYFEFFYEVLVFGKCWIFNPLIDVIVGPISGSSSSHIWEHEHITSMLTLTHIHAIWLISRPSESSDPTSCIWFCFLSLGSLFLLLELCAWNRNLEGKTDDLKDWVISILGGWSFTFSFADALELHWTWWWEQRESECQRDNPKVGWILENVGLSKGMKERVET